jgi:hypothetical protein
MINTYHFTESQLVKLLSDFCEVYNEYDRNSGMPTKSRDAAITEMVEGLNGEKEMVTNGELERKNATSQIIFPAKVQEVISHWLKMNGLEA